IPFWWDRFRQDPYFETMLKYRWEKLREDVISKNTINNFIDSCAVVLKDAQVRNFEKFNILSTYVWPNNYVGGSYANEVNYLKKWISNRIDWLDTQIDKIVPSFVVSSQEIASSLNSDPIVYPNPFSNKFKIEFDSRNYTNVDVVIQNLLGQIVCRKTVSATPGSQAIEFTYDELGQNGNVFIYTISTEGKQVTSGKIMHQ
ncbi:MAG: T9SS type A sorting domain-containing protein, partial [Prolixibacteraceae bacterium]